MLFSFLLKLYSHVYIQLHTNKRHWIKTSTHRHTIPNIMYSTKCLHHEELSALLLCRKAHLKYTMSPGRSVQTMLLELKTNMIVFVKGEGRRIWSPLENIFIFVLCICRFSCVSVNHMLTGAQSLEEGVKSSDPGVTGGCGSPCGCWELKVGLWKSSQCS